MILYNNTLFGLAEGTQYIRASGRNKKPKYSLYHNQRFYPITGHSAKLLEALIGFEELDLKALTALNKTFLYFCESGWAAELPERADRTFIQDQHTYTAEINNKHYILNLLYRSADVISKETYSHIALGQYEKLAKNELFYLYTRRYIQGVGSKQDISTFETQVESKIIYLLFSYQCNLKCTYCFERGQNRTLVMQADVLEDSVKLIDGLSVGSNVVLNFYGGEPLLGIHGERLKHVVRQLSRNNNIRYRFISNGVHILEHMELLETIRDKIISFVITVDGIREIHDKRRVTHDQRGSFDAVMKSIQWLNEKGFPVVIRINVDHENLKSQEQLIRYLNKSIRKKKNVKLEYHRVEDRANPEHKPVDYSDCCKLHKRMRKISRFDVSFSLPVINVLNAINKHSAAPQIKNNYCTINTNYVIDVDGQVYSCNEAMGNTAFSIGRVGQAIEKRHTIAPDEACKKCSLYAACYGGCHLEKHYCSQQNRSNCDYASIEKAIHDYLVSEVKG